MVDLGRLVALFDRIDAEVAALERLAARSDEDLHGDLLAAVKYRFVVAIEAAIDAGQHVIAANRLTSPETFADVFRILAEAKVLTETTASAMSDAARFRNLLVHGYASVDDGQVLTILRARPADLSAFVREVAGNVA